MRDVWVPVVAHGTEDRIVELNGPWDQERGMGCLVRHLGWLLLLLWRLCLGAFARAS